MKEVLLAKYGEIALRGNNRYLFEKRLIDSIKRRLTDDYIISKEQGRILIENDSYFDYEYVIPQIQTVLGITGISPCIKTEDQSIENLQKVAYNYIQNQKGQEKFSIRVETRRADKRYPLTSNEVSALVGGYIFNQMENATVDLHNPDVLLRVELRNDAYIYSESYRGLGGLPEGCSGSGLLLLSGGLDSPVAGFLMAKRGVEISAVYFHSPPYTSERAKEKAIDLAEQLAKFAGNINLFVIPFTEIQLYLTEHVPPEKYVILQKRVMLTIAEKLAIENNCQCLITGDSIGQVASQTVSGIYAIDSAVTIPVMRPLCGLDKQEIVDIAKKIETYEISIRPYEDCCTNFIPKHPETKPKESIIRSIHSSLADLDNLISTAIENKVTILIEIPKLHRNPNLC